MSKTKLKCTNCNAEVEGTWRDDNMHIPGMLYECKCGNKHFMTYNFEED